MFRSSRLLIAAGLMSAACLHAGAASSAPGATDPISGRWSAVASIGEAKVPFRLDLKLDGAAASGTFFDGPRPANPSRSGALTGDHLHLEFPSYAAVLDATVSQGVLDGDYIVSGQATHIHAVRNPAPAAPAAGAPNIDGEWIIPYRSPKGETAWRLIVHQTGARAEASILRIDGDTGTLDGLFSDGAFHLSHYAGERGATLDITPQTDGALGVVLTDGSGAKTLSALRPATAAALGATPTDPTAHTSVRNPDEPFQFAFPDLSGKVVANTDPRFKGKVVLLNVTGSWCPNCHDEAPFLQSLYAKYARDGLEIVGLDFELKPEQVADPARLRAFIARYGLAYTVVLGGIRTEVNAKLPQAVNLNAWPTTFFVGRNGLVRSVHVGFTSPGSGQRDAETRAAIENEIKALLAEPASAKPVAGQ